MNFSQQLYELADKLEAEVNDEHGKYEDHYLKHEDCPSFDRIEWLRDIAAKVSKDQI
jgi:hypothetical protein